jgi:twitching motility protein PilT
MLGTGTVKDVLLEPERIDEIFDLMAEGRQQYGSQTFDQHLMDLVREEAVSYEVAKAAANNPGDFELKMRMFA